MDTVKNETQTSNNVWRIETADKSQWVTVQAWARDEGWDLGIGDADAFFEVDNEGFFIGYIGSQPVAALSMVNYSSEFSYFGHYLVPPSFRGQGHGLHLFQSVIDHCGERTIGLDGMPSQVDNYAKWGFVAHRNNQRLVGQLQQDYACPAGIEAIDESLLDEVIHYDASCTGVNRSALLSRWFSGDDRYGFVCRDGQGISGVVGIRRSQEGYRIGPLFADHPDDVGSLLLAALSVAPRGALITLDVPEKSDTRLFDLAEQHGFESIFHTLRMYRGEPPKEQEHKVWCIASLELG